MKYWIPGLMVFIIFACHNNIPRPQEKEMPIPGDTSLNGVSGNLIMTPEEMKDDSVFSDGSIPTSWKTSGINDGLQLKIFIKFLRNWVEQGNKDSIASHIKYPLNSKIHTPSDFLRQYEEVFNAKVIHALNQQNLSQIFRNQQGAMIGNGELWIRNISPGLTDDFKIVSINY